MLPSLIRSQYAEGMLLLAVQSSRAYNRKRTQDRRFCVHLFITAPPCETMAKTKFSKKRENRKCDDDFVE